MSPGHDHTLIDHLSSQHPPQPGEIPRIGGTGPEHDQFVVVAQNGIGTNPGKTGEIQSQGGEGGAHGITDRQSQGSILDILLGNDDAVVPSQSLVEIASIARSPGAIFRPPEEAGRPGQPGFSQLVVGAKPVESSAPFPIARPAEIVVFHAGVGPQEETVAGRPPGFYAGEIEGLFVETVLPLDSTDPLDEDQPYAKDQYKTSAESLKHHSTRLAKDCFLIRCQRTISMTRLVIEPSWVRAKMMVLMPNCR